MSERPEILWHYTTPRHLPDIAADKALWTTESNIDLFRAHAGPDVVWALDHHLMPDNDLPNGLLHEKTLVRIGFKTPRRAYRWMEWEPALKMDPSWREVLISTGGGQEFADHWWVVDHPVISRHWVSVEWLDKSGSWVSAEKELEKLVERIGEAPAV